jgi:hypothetical protein
MKAETLRELKVPPSELTARVMADVRAWRRPPAVAWLVGAQTAVLAALLFANSPTLPDQVATTTDAVRDWSKSVATAVMEMSDRFGEFVGLRQNEEIL